MSGRIVRTLKNVKDVNKLADHVTSDNDIITDEQGNVYLKHGSKSYLKLGLSKDIESLQTDVSTNSSDITSLKSENKKLKKSVTDLETTNGEQDTTIADLTSRIEALETINVTGVKLDKSTLSLEVGSTATLNATISPENATYKAVSFTSSDDTVATVDDKGVVTGVKAGSADITVESLADGSKTAKCTLTVTEPPKEEEPPTE